MSTPTSTEVALALALRLAELELATYPAPDGGYVEAALPALVFGRLPEVPGHALAVDVYDDLRDRDAWNPDYYVRLRWRVPGEDPLAVHRLADEAFERLHTPGPTVPRQRWPGGVNVLTVLRVTRGAAAPDSNGRYMRADTYRITVNPKGE